MGVAPVPFMIRITAEDETVMIIGEARIWEMKYSRELASYN